MYYVFAIFLAFAFMCSSAFALDLPEGVDPATGYRMDNYRSPTPNKLPGGTVVSDDQMVKMASDGVTILIDVFNGEGAGPDTKTGKWRMAKPHETIPGAVWLPRVGFGTLEKPYDDYFRNQLEKLTSGDKTAPILLFCKADCWPSWNASRRAILWGYTNVFWYPLGSDGYREKGRILQSVEPIDFPIAEAD